MILLDFMKLYAVKTRFNLFSNLREIAENQRKRRQHIKLMQQKSGYSYEKFEHLYSYSFLYKKM